MDTNTRICPVCGKQFVVSARVGKSQVFDKRECKDKYRNSKINALLAEAKDTEDQFVKLYKYAEVLADQLHGMQSYAGTNDKELMKLRREVAASSEDMRYMLNLGVLGVNKQSPNYPLLAEHDAFFKLMVEYEDHRDPEIKRQEAMINELRRRHRNENRMAHEQAYTTEQLDELFQKQRRETSEVNKQCQVYWAWNNIEDYKDNLRETYGAETGRGDPNLQQWYDVLDRNNIQYN